MAQPSINPKIEELRFRLKTDPKSRLFYQLAEELRRAGQFSEAEGVLRNGLVSYPTYLAAWVSLGRVLREQKNDTAAVEALTTALQHDPGNVVAARLLADAYLALGEKVEAIKKYKLVQALLPNGDEELKAVVDQLDREISPPPAPAPPPPAASVAETSTSSDAASDIDFGGDGRDTEPEPLASGVFGEDAGPAEPSVFSDAPMFAEPAAFAEAPVFNDEPAPEVASAPQETAPVPEEKAPTAEVQMSEPAAVPEPLEEEAESPFDRTLPPFAEAERSLDEEIRVERATADVEPMSRAHDDSPFEDAVAGSTAAMEIEAPLGMQIVSAPMSADVASYVDEHLPTVDSTPVFDTVSPAAATESGDAANTITMADLYVRQGLVEEARHIYENILARDPGNAEVRAKFDAITPRVNPKVVVLERWLAKMSKREVGRGL